MFVGGSCTRSPSLNIVETKGWSDLGFIFDGFFDERLGVYSSLLRWYPHETPFLGY